MGFINNNSFASAAIVATDQASQLQVIDPNDIALLKDLVLQLQTDFAAIKPTTGNFRVQDKDDDNDSDFFEVEVDDGTGKAVLKTPGTNPHEFNNLITATQGITVSGGTHDLASAITKLKRIEAAAEPTLTNDEIALWWDTNLTQMWLIHRRSGTQYKVQLT
jgi:hypothetical protein